MYMYIKSSHYTLCINILLVNNISVKQWGGEGRAHLILTMILLGKYSHRFSLSERTWSLKDINQFA